MSLVLTYTPDDDLKKYEPVTIATMTVDDGKSVGEMMIFFRRMLLAMGYEDDSIAKFMTIPDSYPY